MAYSAPYQSEPDHTLRSDVVVLLAMCVFAFVVLGAFFAITFIPQQQFKIGNFFSAYTDVRADTSLTLGTVKLGSSIDQVRAHHANAIKGATADGAITMAFFDGDDRYVVWYGEDGPYHVAYKARQVSELHGVSEDDIIGAVAERYGTPSISSCSRRITDGIRDCQFSWWIPGEVRLDVTSRQNPHATDPVLKITKQITDTRLEGRLQRALQTTTQASTGR